MVDVALPGDGSTDALAGSVHDLVFQVAVVLPRLNAVAGDDLSGRFDRIAVQFHVPGAHGVRRLSAGFVHAHCPHPDVDADGGTVGH